MLYLLHGTDRHKVTAKAGEMLSNLKTRRPDAEVFSMTDDDMNLSRLQELSGGQGLFESKYIVVLKSLLSKKEFAESLAELLPAFATSQNVFIFVEGALLKPTLGVFEKVGAQIQVFAAAPKERQNFFALADALADRDKKRLWVLYVRALRKGASPEEISGMLFWKIKDLFSYNGRGKFSPEELRSTAAKLLRLYHDSHRGLADFETGLERFILSV
ncbi:MAG: hypothetical protein Q7S86_01690 [bacterium]|nr:hypothetical protein [bacterium]